MLFGWERLQGICLKCKFKMSKFDATAGKHLFFFCAAWIESQGVEYRKWCLSCTLPWLGHSSSVGCVCSEHHYLQGDTDQLEWVGLQGMENLRAILCKVHRDIREKNSGGGGGGARMTRDMKLSLNPGGQWVQMCCVPRDCSKTDFSSTQRTLSQWALTRATFGRVSSLSLQVAGRAGWQSVRGAGEGLLHSWGIRLDHLCNPLQSQDAIITITITILLPFELY